MEEVLHVKNKTAVADYYRHHHCLLSFCYGFCFFCIPDFHTDDPGTIYQTVGRKTVRSECSCG